jgi:hypothetical protein
MKVTFEDKKIKIRRKEGIILVCDADVPTDFIEIVKNQTKEIDIPFKLGALSLKNELTIEEIYNLQQKTRNRGRFIAPLVEGFFQNLPDKEYDLVILHSGPVYDLSDFTKELSLKFNKIITQNLNEHDLTTQDFNNFLKEEVFNFSINEILITFNSPSLPYEWESNSHLSLSFDANRKPILKYTGTQNPPKLDINLKIRGVSDETSIEVYVNGVKFKGKLKNDKTSASPAWKLLPHNDKEILKKHLEEYKRNNFETECPLCSIKHRFNKPFLCESSDDFLESIFSRGRFILKSLSSYQSGFILFQFDENNEVKYLSSERNIFEFNNLEFVFISTDQIYKIKCKSSSLEIKEANKICNNLYELEEKFILYLIK